MLTSSLFFLASLGLASANNDKTGLNVLARKAGLKYFGSATDSPGQRERAGFEAVYPQYDQIMWDSGEFGQTTPCNGQKVTLVTWVDTASLANHARSGPSSSPPAATSTTPRARSSRRWRARTASTCAATPLSGTASSPRGSRQPRGPPRSSRPSSSTTSPTSWATGRASATPGTSSTRP